MDYLLYALLALEPIVLWFYVKRKHGFGNKVEYDEVLKKNSYKKSQMVAHLTFCGTTHF